MQRRKQLRIALCERLRQSGLLVILGGFCWGRSVHAQKVETQAVKSNLTAGFVLVDDIQVHESPPERMARFRISYRLQCLLPQGLGYFTPTFADAAGRGGSGRYQAISAWHLPLSAKPNATSLNMPCALSLRYHPHRHSVRNQKNLATSNFSFLFRLYE